MRRLLTAAYKAGHVDTRKAPGFWVTEFAWDTRPPDPNPLAAPIDLQARWTSEALYRSWKSRGLALHVVPAARRAPEHAVPGRAVLPERRGPEGRQAQADVLRLPLPVRRLSQRPRRCRSGAGRRTGGRGRCRCSAGPGRPGAGAERSRPTGSGSSRARCPIGSRRSRKPPRGARAAVPGYRDLVVSASPMFVLAPRRPGAGRRRLT